MVSTTTLFNFDEGKSRKVNRKSKNKTQARKNQSKEIIELVWLQQLINKKTAVIVFVFTIILAFVFSLPKEDMLPIDKIRLSGDFNRLDTKNMEKQLEIYLGKGFFSVDIKSIQHEVSLQPWIQAVSVKRIWPDQLHVNIKERQAIARWDGHHLLSAEAVIFEADSQLFMQLPKINGYSGQTRELLQRYSLMQQQFSMHGISISEMSEDSKGAMSLLLNNRLKVNIGSENNEQKIKHLLAVYPQQIKPRADLIKYIDFRYSNGFAIAWKNDDLKPSGETVERGNKNV